MVVMNKKFSILTNRKKIWESPNLFLLRYKETTSGYTTGTPEDQSYDPVISPN